MLSLYDSISMLNNNCTKRSILVGGYFGKLINFDPVNMAEIETYKISTNESYVLDIIRMSEDKILTNIYMQGVKIYNNNVDPEFTKEETNFDFYFSPRIIRMTDELAVGVSYKNKTFIINVENQIAITNNTKNYKMISKYNCKVCILGGVNGQLDILDVKRNKITPGVNSGGVIQDLLNLRNGDGVISFSSGVLKLWDLQSKIGLKEVLQIHDSGYRTDTHFEQMIQLTDGRIVKCDSKNNIHLIDLKTFERTFLSEHKKSVWNYYQLSDNIILSCSSDRSIRKWDLRIPAKSLDEVRFTFPIYRFESPSN